MSLLKQAQQSVADHTKAEETAPSIPPEGKSVARLTEYVEIGKRQQTYQGKETAPAYEVKIAFQLLSPKFMREFESDGQKRKVPYVIRQNLTIKTGDRANFGKLFRKMAAGRDVTNMAQMLGEAFILQVVHNKRTYEGKDRVFANIRDKDGSWLVEAPVVYDPIEGTSRPVAVPEVADDQYRLLLWNNPTKEQWDSLFIDGTRIDNEGNEVSKNWLQEDIISNALDYEGSALESLLTGLDGLSLPKAARARAEALEEAQEPFPVSEAPTPASGKKAAPEGAPAVSDGPADQDPGEPEDADEVMRALGLL